MMNFFPLDIFPQGSLSSSVITTVWVGVFVVAFFNLRFGWVLSGLVIPGYVVPLLLIKPWSVLAIFVESIAAYYLVWMFSHYFSRYGFWSALFGRDRFFALILASITTRIIFDGWLLPIAGSWLQSYGVIFDFRNELHSLGLVVVALMANQFWKTGVVRGLPPLLITLLVTWLIVKYLLIPFTNFGLGGLSYMYEDIAASILASPKAYIILVTTAFVASRMNRRYGWDFNGILIPALLALQWYEPTKILISFVESFIILGIAILTLRLPWLANTTIEGARKLLLFFNIAFLYKIILAYAIAYVWPETKVSDYFAFGYLLSTLLAIKMHEKGIVIRMTRATVQTSLVSIVIASVFGYLLTIMPSFQPWSIPGSQQKINQLLISNETLLTKLQNIKPDIYRYRFTETGTPLPQETDIFVEAINLLMQYSKSNSSEKLQQSLRYLQKIGYQVELVEQQYLLISQLSFNRNWGIYVINLKAANELLVEVPSPLEERGLLEGSTILYEKLSARSFAIAGGNTNKHNNQAFFDGFHRLVGRRDVLQVHGYSKEISRALALNSAKSETAIAAQKNGELWVKNRLPASLDLLQLKNSLGEYSVNWGEIDYPNLLRNNSREGFAEIVLNREGLRRLQISSLLNARRATYQTGDQSIEGFLEEWLLERRGEIANSGTNAYQLPKVEELLYLDDEVITPLLQTIKAGYKKGNWNSEALEEIQVINSAAAVLGYKILLYRHNETGKDYVILAEREQQSRRYWGSYVFRLGVSVPYILQSPRPLLEVNSFEVAVSLFERMQASAILIGGTHPLTNRDYTSDLVRPANQVSLFTLVNQVIMREQGNSELLAVQCRALDQKLGEKLPDADILVSFDDAANQDGSFTALQKQLINTLKKDNWSLRYVDGSVETSGYQVGGTPQAKYIQASENKNFALLWVSPLVRSSFKQQRNDDGLSKQFLSLGIVTVEDDVSQLIYNSAKGAIATVSDSMISDLDDYQETLDIVLLTKLKAADKSIIRVIDKHTKQTFLLLHNKRSQLVLLGNLNPLKLQSQQNFKLDELDRKKIREYIDTRTSKLVFVQ